MKFILIFFMIFINLFASNPKNSYYDKNNPEHIKEAKSIQNTIKINLKDRLDKFRNQNLETVVEVEVNEEGKYYFKIIKNSTNKDYDKTIQEFLNEENGKKYYENPNFLRLRISFIPNF